MIALGARARAGGRHRQCQARCRCPIRPVPPISGIACSASAPASRCGLRAAPTEARTRRCWRRTRQARTTHADLVLVLAPRHPERVAEVMTLVAARGSDGGPAQRAVRRAAARRADHRARHRRRAGRSSTRSPTSCSWAAASWPSAATTCWSPPCAASRCSSVPTPTTSARRRRCCSTPAGRPSCTTPASSRPSCSSCSPTPTFAAAGAPPPARRPRRGTAPPARRSIWSRAICTAGAGDVSGRGRLVQGWERGFTAGADGGAGRAGRKLPRTAGRPRVALRARRTSQHMHSTAQWSRSATSPSGARARRRRSSWRCARSLTSATGRPS